MTRTRDEVLLEITEIFRKVLDQPAVELNFTTTANDVEGWDSLSHIELVVAIEKHFQIKFNFTELQKFKNIGEMCDNIVVKLAQGTR